MNIREEIKKFDQLIKEYPNISELHIGRAQLYKKIGKYKKAVKDYENALMGSYVRYDILSICERNDLIKEAEILYTKSINEIKNSKNYLSRAFFYKRIGKNNKALLDCEVGLTLSPNNKNLLTLKKILTKKLN